MFSCQQLPEQLRLYSEHRSSNCRSRAASYCTQQGVSRPEGVRTRTHTVIVIFRQRSHAIIGAECVRIGVKAVDARLKFQIRYATSIFTQQGVSCSEGVRTSRHAVIVVFRQRSPAIIGADSFQIALVPKPSMQA